MMSNDLLHIEALASVASLELVLALALVDESRDAFAGWAIVADLKHGPGSHEDGGPEWLVLYQYLPAPPSSGAHESNVKPFLVPHPPEELAPFVLRWLELSAPGTAQPSPFDGTIRPGAFVAWSSWELGRYQGTGAVLALRREWATYHK